jgi:lambda repressor-like predicted transcriptional regulator
MSLAKLPLRVAAVMALRGATFAGDAVFDSAIAPLAESVVKQQGLPLIVVYSDDAVADPASRLTASDLVGFVPTVTLTFHAAIATTIEVTSSGQVVRLADSDAAFEALLDILEAQILAALQRRGGAWAELWRTFALRVGTLQSRRGASVRKGTRFAAREIVLDVESVADPSGHGGEYPWNTALAALAADEATEEIATLLGGIVDAEVGEPDWAAMLNNTGLAYTRAKALGFVTAAGEEIVFP